MLGIPPLFMGTVMVKTFKKNTCEAIKLLPPDGYKPGWKIQEGSNFWSVDLDSPYWKTEEGSKELKASKKRGSWIEQEASAYAKENPGVDAPIASYYATDGCGEGKQPANSSC